MHLLKIWTFCSVALHGYSLINLLLTYLLTPWCRVLPEKLTGFVANQEIPLILWNPKVHYRTHKRSPPVPILSQLHPVPTTPYYFLKIHLNIVLPSTSWSPQSSLSLRFPHQDLVHNSPFLHTCHMPRCSTKLPFRTSPTRYRPSRLMRWLIRFITLHITRAGQVLGRGGDFLSLEVRSVRLCQSAELVPSTLLFKEPPRRNVAINVVIFWNVAKANARWTVDVRSVMLLNGFPTWARSVAVCGLPVNYVSLNEELTPPQLVCVLIFKLIKSC